MEDLLRQIAHRAYPPNPAPWVMRQRWFNLAFMHWRIEPALVLAKLPEGLELETFDGSAWVGLVPFAATAQPRAVPFKLPFLEMNVRTYVRCQGKSGVYFFSMDASHFAVIEGARRFFYLPYFDAKMKLEKANGAVIYESRRHDARAVKDGIGPDAVFLGRYKPIGDAFEARPGTLEEFLVERYCLWTHDGHRIRCCDIHHARWPLQPAEVEITTNSTTDFFGAKLPLQPDHVLFVSSIDTLEWWLS